MPIIYSLYVMSALTAYGRPSSDEDLHLHQTHVPVDERFQILSLLPAGERVAYFRFISEPARITIKLTIP